MKRPPLLLVTVELEGWPAVQLLADSAEDERRLTAWLAKAEVIDEIPALVRAVVAGLEERAA